MFKRQSESGADTWLGVRPIDNFGEVSAPVAMAVIVYFRRIKGRKRSRRIEGFLFCFYFWAVH